jgi:hypothetical protein
MGLKVTQNFDWSMTNRKVVVFIPNYQRHDYVEFGVKNFLTSLPKKDWVIIIGNDGYHHNFDHLIPHNAYCFSLEHDMLKPRNSAFIRNYAIKRSASEIFFQKDPEVLVNGDFLSIAVDRHENAMSFKCGGWKAGYVLNFHHEPTQEILSHGVSKIIPYLRDHIRKPRVSGDFEHQNFAGGSRTIVSNSGYFEPNKVQSEILGGGLNVSNWFSYVVGLSTEILQDMRGYDEDFTSYGYEDSDMFCRLMSMHYPIIPEYACTSIHLDHPLTVNAEEIDNMEHIFRNKYMKVHRRNPKKWGEGI